MGIRLAARWMPKAKHWLEGRKQQSLRLKAFAIPANRPRVWMHCASTGEYEQGRPVLQAIRNQYPEAFLIVSFFSPSGYQARQSDPLIDLILYLPPDLPGQANRFLDFLQPQLVIFVKYEFWFGYLNTLWQRQIPCILISARFQKNQLFFKPYGGFFRKLLGGFTHIFVQDEASQLLLQAYGITRVSVSGDTRCDRVIEIATHWKPDTLVAAFLRGRKAVVIGSSWPEDDKLWLAYLQQHRLKTPVIWVPHEIQEQQVEHLRQAWPNGKAIRYSAWESRVEQIPEYVDLLIVDRIGLLSRLYAYGWMAYVGGGFGAGIHNVLEAAVYGIPVVFGPKYTRFQEAVDLVSMQAAFVVKHVDMLHQVICRLSRSSEAQASGAIARGYVETHAGATRVIMAYLEEKRFLTTA